MSNRLTHILETVDALARVTTAAADLPPRVLTLHAKRDLLRLCARIGYTPH